MIKSVDVNRLHSAPLNYCFELSNDIVAPPKKAFVVFPFRCLIKMFFSSSFCYKFVSIFCCFCFVIITPFTTLNSLKKIKKNVFFLADDIFIKFSLCSFKRIRFRTLIIIDELVLRMVRFGYRMDNFFSSAILFYCV